MENNSKRLSSAPVGISGDVVILLVFFIIGTILFVSFAMGFIYFGRSPSTTTPGPTAAFTALKLTVTPRLTGTVTGTATRTLVSPITTPTSLYTSMPSLTPLPGVKTSTPVVYKSSTPVVYKSSTPVKSKTPTRTNVPVRTSTRTMTPTVTVTLTITPTGFTSTPTITATGTETLTPTVTSTATETATPTVTATSTVTATPTITPVRDCVASIPPGTQIAPSDDTWIDGTSPTTNHGTASDTLLITQADSGGNQRILLKFNLSAYTNPSIASAKLYFYISSTSGATIFLYKPTTSWKGIEATWLTAQSGTNWISAGGDYNPAPIISTSTMANCRVQLDITTLVQEWITTPSTNNGIIMIASGPSGPIKILSSRVADGPVLLINP